MQRQDDFDWAVYDELYESELNDIAAVHTQILLGDEYAFDSGTLSQVAGNRKPLHPNHRLLYETILQLAPETVCEFGCGGGDHLHNLSRLDPTLVLSGFDRSRAQLRLLRRRHPELNASVRLSDITRAQPKGYSPVDIAFTQAVLMHMQTGRNHLEGLANLFRSARSAVILMENWTRHPFLDDIRTLESAGIIPWDDLHIYYRESPEFARPHIMVASSVELPDLPELREYATLLDPLR